MRRLKPTTSAARIAAKRRSIEAPQNVVSPFQDRARPGEPAAENNHQNVIAALDPAAAIRFIECDRYSRSGRIPVTIQIHKHLVPRNVEPIGDRLDDAQICLMWNDTGYV